MFISSNIINQKAIQEMKTSETKGNWNERMQLEKNNQRKP